MLDMEDLRKKVLAEEEEMKRLVSVKGDHIVLNIAGEYPIALNRCRTYEQILAWVLHLSDKTWITTEVLARFIRIACHANGIAQPNE